ncbi:flagellar hook assembly protein FlgD [Bacillus piscicola]|uniref:flagellar hook assembly protein FlgD n=1 Tax=Bacillus piscicola TaxID=1632684 RepID=UPI001F08BF5C|nr:flagellar hook assembly protein FlgD [Bacillus piscicola]
MSNTVQQTYALPAKNEPKITSKQGNMMGKDDFLKILIAQLSNQDPLNPMEDKEFIAQMAQFSSLEQMTNMNTALQRFVNAQESGALVQHSELIGQNITWIKLIEKDGHVIETKEIENTVQSVKRDLDGNIRLLLDDGRWINSEQLLQVGRESSVSEEPDLDDSHNEEKADEPVVE